MKENELEYYKKRARLDEYKDRLESAIRLVVRGKEAMGHPYISCSWGKDSVALTHLVLSIFPKVPVLNVNGGKWYEWPGTPLVRQKFLTKYPCEYHEVQGPSLIDAYRKVGFFVQDEERTPAQRQASRAYSKAKRACFNDFARTHGFSGSYIGMRADENQKTRGALFRYRGPIYFAKTRGLWACHPLAYWEAKDTWTYIVSHGLPYDDLYDRSPNRELQRNGAMAGSRSARYGRLHLLARMYPDWFNRLIVEFPEVRNYL